MLPRSLLVLPLVILLPGPIRAENYLMRFDFVEMDYDSQSNVDDLVRKMIVRPLEVTVTPGKKFHKKVVLSGHTLEVKGKVERAWDNKVQATDWSIRDAAEDGACTSASSRTECAVGDVVLCSGAMRRKVSPDGTSRTLFEPVFQTVWELPLDKESLAQKRAALARSRAALVRSDILQRRAREAANEQAAVSLLGLARQHVAAGELRVANLLLNALTAQFYGTKAFQEAQNLRNEIENELQKKEPKRVPLT